MDKIRFYKQKTTVSDILRWDLIVNDCCMYGYSIVMSERNTFLLNKGVSGQHVYSQGYLDLNMAKYELISSFYQKNIE